MATGKQPLTFISYSRVNQDFAVRLAEELKAAGYPVWLDQLDIPAGARWDDEIERVLRECAIFLAILTPAFIESDNAKDEIGYAIDHDKRILPVLLEKCDIPLRMSRLQYVDFTRLSYREGVQRAKQLLGGLMADEARGAPTKTSASVKTRERPTQPARARSEQTKSKSRKNASKESSAIGSLLSRPGAIYLGAGAVLLLVLLFAGSVILPGMLAAASKTPTIVPTSPIVSTGTPAPTPTAIPDSATPAPAEFYVEDFDGQALDWQFFISDGEQRDHRWGLENGRLVIHIADAVNRRFAAFLINEAFEYTAARMEAVVHNTGNNTNGFSLICNYSDSGWYEFRVSSGEKYQILAFGPGGSIPQSGNQLASATSTAIKTGKATNIIAATCTEEVLTLEINGVPLPPVNARYDLPPGNVGLGFSAPGEVPVDLEIESFTVSQP